MRSSEYFIPDVGAIRAEFFKESETLFELLERKGEIDRTKNLAQLGIVRRAWPMARHTRWDFTMLMLDLVRRARDLQAVHLTSHVNVGGGVQVSSSRELINCWALLLSVGHLHGTFASETEVLFAIKRSVQKLALEAELTESVPDAASDWAGRVLRDERTFQFHQLLAFYRLERLAERSKHLGLWQALLTAYVTERRDESKALTQARSLFRRIRRLAFLTLDASVTPGPVEIRLAQVTSSPGALERLLLDTSDWAGEDELVGLEEYLNREVYHGRDVLAEVAATRAEARRRIEKQLEDHGLRHTVESAAKGDELLRPPTTHEVRPIVRGHLGGPFVRLVQRDNDRSLDRRTYEDAFRRWTKLVGSNASVLLVRNAAGSQLIFQTHVHGPAARNEACAIVGATRLTERLRGPWMSRFSGGTGWDLSQRVSVPASTGITKAALDHFFTTPAHWEWEDSPRGPRCVVGPKHQVTAHLASLADAEAIGRARRVELNALLQRARRIRASILVIPCANLIAYAESSSQQLCEIDGLIVGIDSKRSDLVLSLVEAKYTSGAEAKCRRQLTELVQCLQPAAYVRKGRVQASSQGRRGEAWIYIRSRYTR